MARQIHPPRFAEQFLLWFCNEAYAEEIHGDMEEIFLEEVEDLGVRRAKWRFIVRVFSFIRPRYIRRSRRVLQFTLFWNYVLIARRNLLKYKRYSAFSLFCLVLGLSSGLLMMGYVLDELSYDRSLTDHDRIYRLAQHVDMESGELDAAITPGPLGFRMKEDLSWVQDHAVVSVFNRFTFELDDEKYSEPHAHFVNRDFLKVFKYPLLVGDAATVFDQPRSILISQSLAERFFGEEEALGQDLPVEGRGTFTVTGVMEDVPSNSHFHPKALLFMGEEAVTENGWLDHSFYTYILMNEGQTPADVEESLNGFHERVLTEPLKESFAGTGYMYLQPVTSIHLQSHLNYELETNSNMTDVLSLSGLALFILVVVGINYLNISSAQATRRIREVGVRKVLGSNRSMIVAQFYMESLILCVVAGVLGKALAYALLPSFNYVSGKEFDYTFLLDGPNGLIYFGTVLILALISGSYAALFLSGFKIEDALRKKVSFTRLKLPVSKTLNAFQFVVSLVMIILTIAVTQQIDYARNRDLGFDQSQVLKVELTHRMGAERMLAIANELESHHQIARVASAMKSPGDDFWADGLFFEKSDGSFGSLKTEFNAVDKHFVPALSLRIVEGRGFGLHSTDEQGMAVIVNEQIVKDLGYLENREIIGKHVKLPLGQDHQAVIVGVSANAHMRSLHHSVGPQILVNFPPIATQLLVKLEGRPSPEVLSFIDEKVESFTQSNTHKVAFLDQHYWQQYEGEQRRSSLFSIFSMLTVVLAFAGLTALISFQVRLQAKNINLRKIFGAGFGDIVLSYLKSYAWQVAIGLILALPLSVYLVNRWLSNFAYRVDLPVVPMVAAGIALASGVLLVVALHAKSSFRVNPATYLSEE